MNKRYESGAPPESALNLRAGIARQMKDARQEQQLTQQSLAERAGTKKSNISRMESGRYNPTLDFLVKVAESMNKSVSITIE